MLKVTFRDWVWFQGEKRDKGSRKNPLISAGNFHYSGEGFDCGKGGGHQQLPLGDEFVF